MCGGKATEEQIADRLEADVSTKRSDEPTERTRAAVASNAEEYRSRIAKRLRAVKGGLTGGIGRPKNSLSDASADKLSDEPKTDTRAAVASNAEEYRSRIAKRQRAVAGYSAVVRDEETGKFNRLSADASDKRSDEPKTDTRAAVAN